MKLFANISKALILSTLLIFSINPIFGQNQSDSKISSDAEITENFVVGGYLPYYGINKVTSDIFNRLTHLYYFSLGPNVSGDLGRIDNSGNFTSVSQLSSVKNDIDKLKGWRGTKTTKIFLVIGGWVQSDYFDEAVSNSTSRATLVAKIKSLCITYGVDGVDIDWEGYHGNVVDSYYGLFLSELRTAFSGTDLQISIAVGSSHTSLADEFVHADFVQLMSYGKIFDRDSQVSLIQLKKMVNAWTTAGLPSSKLVIGLPAYGRCVEDNTALTYRKMNELFSLQPDDMVTYENKVYYFNNVETVKIKTKYAIDRGLKGVMMWELSQDILTSDPNSLIYNAHKTVVDVSTGINNNLDKDINDVNIYPCPTVNTVTLDLNTNSNNKTNITAYSVSGQVMWVSHDELSSEKQKVNIDVSKWSKGVYIIKGEVGNDTFFKKFVKH